MLMSIIFKLFFIFACLIQVNHGYEAFGQEDEVEYLNAFSTLIKDSYSAPLPQSLIATCKNQPQTRTTTIKSITESMLSSDLQAFCGTESICTVPSGLTVTMNSNLNVAALVLHGSLIWNDLSQTLTEQWLCAGYIAVSFYFHHKINMFVFFIKVNGGQFNMNLSNKQGYIYIKNNGLTDPIVYTRAFGAYNAGKIYVRGRTLRRTWSLLANKATYGMTSIDLLHTPQDMVSLKIDQSIVIFYCCIL